MNVDPSHYLPNSAGGTGKPPLLKLQNLASRPQLNGQFGQAVSYSAGRYVVAILDASYAAAAASGGGNTAQPRMMKLKPENLTEAGMFDQLKFGASMMLQSAQAYATGPSMQQWGQKVINVCPHAIQDKVTPKMALMGMVFGVLSTLALVWLLLCKVMGFQKVFVVVSLISLLLAVSSPDWMEGLKAKKPMKLIVKGSAGNFRRRWKENMVNMSGYTNISERMALCSLVLILLFSGKILLTPSPPSGLSQISNMPMAENAPRVHSPPPPQYDLEHIYKLGYDDASAGTDFGTSIPEDIIKYNAAQEALPPQDRYNTNAANGDYDWRPPSSTPPPTKSSFGMGTMLSMMTLYRFGKELVTTPDGAIVTDPMYVMAGLRSMEKWKIGTLVLSSYRVASALSSFL